MSDAGDLAAPAPARTARRKVAIRLLLAPVLLLLLAGVVYLDYSGSHRWALLGILTLGSLAMWAELCAMAAARGHRLAVASGIVFLLVAACAGPWATWPSVDLRNRLADLPGVWSPAVVAWMSLLLVFRHPRFSPVEAGISAGGLLMVGLLFLGPQAEHIVYAARGNRAGFGFIAFLLVAAKGSDMAAYAAGKLVGRHKMTPRLSPNKTWEGAVAGMIAGTAAGAVALNFVRPSAWPVHLLAAAVTTAGAQLGDLAASAWKRWSGVKDSGRLLPEFGGALDLLDSFLLAAPAAYLCAWARWV